MSTPKHPIQPLVEDKHGTMRFKENRVVHYLLEHGGIDLNDLAIKFADAEYNDDRAQLAQLIGYSHSGASGLGYVSDEILDAAMAMRHDAAASEKDARIAFLEAELKAVRDGMRDGVARLYHKHPDDLKGESYA